MTLFDFMKPAYTNFANAMRTLLILSLAVFAFSCGKDDPEPNPDAAGTDFGKITSAVVIVNPKINEGSSTTVASGTERSGVTIKAGELAPVKTDATGLAVIKNLLPERFLCCFLMRQST